MADVPYGIMTEWTGVAGSPPAGWTTLDALLEAVAPLLAPDGVVMLASGKDQKVTHPAWKRVEKETAGKRRIGIYTRIGSTPAQTPHGGTYTTMSLQEEPSHGH